MRPCYSRRQHYPILEKLGVKNLAVCENQGKQHKPKVMKNKAGRGDAKKTKRRTEIQVLTKDSTVST